MKQVTLKTNLEVNKTYGCVRFTQYLSQFEGKQVNIIDDCGQGIYRIQESIFTISEEMIEREATEFEATVTVRLKFTCVLNEAEKGYVKSNFPGDFERYQNRGLYDKLERSLPFSDEVDIFQSIKITEKE